MNRSTTRHRLAAFTLAEVVVAMAIFAGGIMGVLGAFSLSMQAGTRGTLVQDAARVAANRLELAVALPNEGLAQQSGVEGRYQWTVSYASKPHDLLAATATVQWLEKDQVQNYRLERVFRPRAAQ